MPSYSLVRFETENGPRAGLLVDGKVIDAAEATGNPSYGSMKAILNDWSSAEKALEKAFADGGLAGRGVAVAQARLLAPIDDPAGIFCIGSNYRDHALSIAKALGMEPEPDPHTLGLKPWFFLKTAHAVAAPGQAVEMSGEKMDWEAELAAVIGRPARNVSIEDALSYVAAYTIANDLSARDRAMRPKVREGSPFRPDWVAQKNFDHSCPIGPALVPASVVGDPQKLPIRLWVNNELKQDSNTDQMIFLIAEQIAHLSSLITLRPGDVVLTGTPAGTGAESKTFLNRGDVIRVEVGGLGELTTPVK